jgi:hypothetical protein
VKGENMSVINTKHSRSWVDDTTPTSRRSGRKDEGMNEEFDKADMVMAFVLGYMVSGIISILIVLYNALQ